jgi:hypothetical protein
MKRRSLKVQLLKWILCRRGRVVTCQLDRTGRQYRLSVQPYGQRENRFVELFDATAAAFQRHAAVVTNLRDSGWTTVAYR